MTFRITPTFRKLHRWIGLAIAAPMVVQGVTGTILSVAPLIDSWNAPALHAAPSPPAAADDIMEAATDAAPDGLRVSRYVVPHDRVPAMVDFSRPGTRQTAFRLWIDPSSLDVLATKTNPDRWVAPVREIHESFLLPMPVGRSVVGWGGFFLMAMVITGLPVWWVAGRRLAAFRVSTRARGLRALREWHIAIALWMVIPLFFQAFSGVTISFPNTARALLGLPPNHFVQHGPPHEHETGAMPHPHGPRLDIVAVLSQAATAAPGLTAMEVRVPPNGQGTVMVRLRDPAAWRGMPPQTVQVATDGSHVIHTNDASNRSIATATLGWLRALHTANAGGAVWLLVQILTGLMLPAMAITGFFYWLVRKLRKARQSRLADVMQARGA